MNSTKKYIKLKKTFFFIGCYLIITSLNSCQPKPIDIDVTPADNKLVISSQIIPNKIMLVSVTRNFSALEDESKKDTLSDDFLNSLLVKNAIVTVSYFEHTDTLFMVTPGLYASVNTLLYNYGNYYLTVKDIEMNLSATATTTLLPRVDFDTIYPSISKSTNDTSVSIHYKLTDDVNIENYYVINYIRKLNGSNNSVPDINQFFSNGNNSLESYFDLLNDNSFNNGNYTLDKKLETVSHNDSIAVTVSNISKDYYEFLSVYKRSGALFNQLTGEPIHYPTNINNGYGFFNAHYPSIKYFDLKNY